ncbi:cob(I)alamin adenosyltransferase [Hathewaya proteolytica DSM 3090]|uniref:Cob(I)alamin adenosyltransferase n=1 Tax=Hathewaya proteolytica DSM 3090 TaxID=1121331 RepID=A0A1M6N6Q1_9CLOT|nr:cob(I)yrinic acid a,c-diamide adenosyltransferase [Hathewaya proteolytica]SHJ91381.1 cob(I)alamin adenosyltransferase [Hathewaya proteolytica DSM 3090]
MENGKFQIYTGDGKGKTTAAMGLALRAVGAGMKVYIGQFIKDMEYSEIKIMKSFPQVTVELYGTGKGCLIFREPDKEDINCAQQGLEKACEAMMSGKYDMVIMDEINVACSLNLLTPTELMETVKMRPDNVELVFTGRGATEDIIKLADLVTEMKEVKHYYRTGLMARDGIER